MIVVELQKLFRRPRTWATLVLLDLLPTVVAALGHQSDRTGAGGVGLCGALRCRRGSSECGEHGKSEESQDSQTHGGPPCTSILRSFRSICTVI